MLICTKHIFYQINFCQLIFCDFMPCTRVNNWFTWRSFQYHFDHKKKSHSHNRNSSEKKIPQFHKEYDVECRFNLTRQKVVLFIKALQLWIAGTQTTLYANSRPNQQRQKYCLVRMYMRNITSGYGSELQNIYNLLFSIRWFNQQFRIQ